MSQGLYLSQKMTLAQVLAPQLQQSLALLQAPTLELQAMVAKELEQNPILEEVVVEGPIQESPHEEGDLPAGLGDSMDPAEPPKDVTFDPATEKPEGAVDDFQAEVDRLMQMDQEWRDHFSQTNVPLRSREEDEEKRQYLFDSLAVGVSLQECLLEQMRFSPLRSEQHPVAEMIIGNIDDQGYLRSAVEEMAKGTSLPPSQIEEVLRVIQTFHPAGVGARDLRECLLLQLERANQQETLAYRIVRDGFEALAKHRIPELARQMLASIEEIQEAQARIAHLDPRPGRAYSSENEMYVTPEVFVTRSEEGYAISSNEDHLPHLRISHTYKDLLADAGASEEVRNYIREKIRAGKFLIKSLHQRRETILNIARQIVQRQHGFLERGVAHLVPMTMAEVAKVVGVHETTVSRAVSGKYIQTPQGIFEMRFFFTSGLRTRNGPEISNTSVKELIADVFAREDPTKPLSDDYVSDLMKSRGINVARRTVAKYRGELNILPSHLRKVYRSAESPGLSVKVLPLVTSAPADAASVPVELVESGIGGPFPSEETALDELEDLVEQTATDRLDEEAPAGPPLQPSESSLFPAASEAALEPSRLA